MQLSLNMVWRLSQSSAMSLCAASQKISCRNPLEELLFDLADHVGIGRTHVVLVGESRISDLKTRPDFAVTRNKMHVGFIEVKAPGKGPDPRRFTDKHDKDQWQKLQSLPNLIYTDGNGFSLWRDGHLVGEVVHLAGDVSTAGANLKGDHRLEALIDDFLKWSPVPPRDVKQLAHTTARLCRLLREEVAEQLAAENPALVNLALGWRKMLFPEADDKQFADGYAQAVTFGLLVARARDIDLTHGVENAAKELGQQSSLIGTALRVLIDEVQGQRALTTSIDTLTRVIGVVDWGRLSHGKPDAWLYFYEDFLAIYDNELRKKTGSYYTPPEVVKEMVRLVDDVLASPDYFDRPEGLATPGVNIVDPALGTGTFLLGVLNRIAGRMEYKDGKGAVPGGLEAALSRMFGFEIQLGPFAVAQLRILAELVELSKPNSPPPGGSLCLYVTDTLSNPDTEIEYLPNTYKEISESRKEANKVKRDVPITVVIGNPPYKEKAKGKGGWIEAGGMNESAPLAAWLPPADWEASAHAKHLYNLYVYFWRWATWKVFDQKKGDSSGLVCFITVAGFLNGPGFQRMREYLRKKADQIWVIDCSPEGHQPDASTRIFQGVQQPVCIVLASRSKGDESKPASVQYQRLPEGARASKFAALAKISIEGSGWENCPSENRASFLPISLGGWEQFPKLEDFFVYSGSGVMPGRTWVIAPDPQSLKTRWARLTAAKPEEVEDLFHPHLLKNELGDKHSKKFLKEGLTGHEARLRPVSEDKMEVITPIRYGFRSFDIQWIIPDARLLNRPNPTLWDNYSNKQVFLTAFHAVAPKSGPAVTFTALLPDLDHYKGSFGGRAFPLYSNAAATKANLPQPLLRHLSGLYGVDVDAEQLAAYIAAIAAHPNYTKRFADELRKPGLRIPLTADVDLFREGVALGKRVIWLHCYGERLYDPNDGRPRSAPRVEGEYRPHVPADGAISGAPDDMANELKYDQQSHRVRVGTGAIVNVSPAVWNYEVSGKNVIRHWFSYRKKDREKPPMGDKRPPSKLSEIQPAGWLPEYTSSFVDLLNVLTLLVELEPEQTRFLGAIVAGPLVSRADLVTAGAIPDEGQKRQKGKKRVTQPSFADMD